MAATREVRREEQARAPRRHDGRGRGRPRLPRLGPARGAPRRRVAHHRAQAHRHGPGPARPGAPLPGPDVEGPADHAARHRRRRHRALGHRGQGREPAHPPAARLLSRPGAGLCQLGGARHQAGLCGGGGALQERRLDGATRSTRPPIPRSTSRSARRCAAWWAAASPSCSIRRGPTTIPRRFAWDGRSRSWASTGTRTPGRRRPLQLRQAQAAAPHPDPRHRVLAGRLHRLCALARGPRHRLSARGRRGQGRDLGAGQGRASRRGLPHELRDPPRRQLAEQRREPPRDHGHQELRVLRGAAAGRGAEVRPGARTSRWIPTASSTR